MFVVVCCVVFGYIGCACDMLCECLMWFSVFLRVLCLDVVFVHHGSIVWLCVVSVWGICVVAFGMLGCMVVFV